MKALKHHWMEPKTIWILCISSLFVTGKRRKKRTKSMCMETRSALNLNKLLNFWPSQKLKYFFVTFINVSEPSVQYIPSTNSTSKGISTQKPEAKSQVSEIMAKQIIKPKGMCGKPAHFSLTWWMTAIGIVDSAIKNGQFQLIKFCDLVSQF